MDSYKDFLLSEATTDKKDNIKFVHKRKEGASAIAAKAASKGSYAQLTAWHFKAKLPQYDEALKAITRGENMEFFQRKFNNLLRQLKPRSMSQQVFQKISGELEVYGEILIQLRSGKLY